MGNSMNPRTHVEAVRVSDGALRPVLFRDGFVADKGLLSPPSATKPWFKLDKHGIPKDSVTIWPASTTPGFRSPAVGFSIGGDWDAQLILRSHQTSFSAAAGVGAHVGRIRRTKAGGHRARGHVGEPLFWHDNFTAFSADAQRLFGDEGKRLVHVTTWLEGSTRFWLGIARAGD